MSERKKCECSDGPDPLFDEHTNTTYCFKCGEALERSAIVSETVFSETSNGRSVATGIYGAADATGARSALGRRGAGLESRQVTLANGHRRIEAVSNGMNLGGAVKDSAMRLFNLAVSNGFVQGRRTDYVVAACLYAGCRLTNKTDVMLIDFSDLLKVNVFVLGATFLKLVRSLSLAGKLSATDPAHLIQRFAALLDFGEETQRVATDAIKLVQRFDRDWLVQGRRPAGICGACLLLAARMNNFRRSLDEIVQVVKIADVTVRKRLEEFKATASGKLSVEEFRKSWLDQPAADPPAFVESQRRDREATEKVDAMEVASPSPNKRPRSSVTPAPTAKRHRSATPAPEPQAATEEELAVNGEISNDVRSMLESSEGAAMTDALDEKERIAQQERSKAAEVAKEAEDLLDDLDEEELDQFILTEEEKAMKERLWVLNNKDYLETLAEKHLRGEAEEPRKRRRRRKPAAARDSTNASAATAADATRQLLAKKKISRKLDYAAFDSLFADNCKNEKRSQSVATEGPADGSDEEEDEEEEDEEDED